MIPWWGYGFYLIESGGGAAFLWRIGGWRWALLCFVLCVAFGFIGWFNLALAMSS